MRQITITVTAVAQDEPLDAASGYEGQLVTNGFVQDYLLGAAEYVVPGMTITGAVVNGDTSA